MDNKHHPDIMKKINRDEHLGLFKVISSDPYWPNFADFVIETVIFDAIDFKGKYETTVINTNKYILGDILFASWRIATDFINRYIITEAECNELGSELSSKFVYALAEYLDFSDKEIGILLKSRIKHYRNTIGTAFLWPQCDIKMLETELYRFLEYDLTHNKYSKIYILPKSTSTKNIQLFSEMTDLLSLLIDDLYALFDEYGYKRIHINLKKNGR